MFVIDNYYKIVYVIENQSYFVWMGTFERTIEKPSAFHVNVHK